MLKRALFLIELSIFTYFGFTETVSKTPKYELETIKNESSTIITEIVYPVFSDFTEVNERIKTFLSSKTTLCADLESMWEEYDKMYQHIFPNTKTDPFFYSLKATTILANCQYISIFFTQCYDGPNGLGNIFFYTLTYDIKSERFVSITDVSPYTLQELSKLCYESLCSQLSNEKPSYEWIAKGTSADNIQNFSCFTFDGQTLTIYIEPYQIGDGSNSLKNVRLPVKESKPE